MASVDGHEVHFLAEQGTLIHNAAECGELIVIPTPQQMVDSWSGLTESNHLASAYVEPCETWEELKKWLHENYEGILSEERMKYLENYCRELENE